MSDSCLHLKIAANAVNSGVQSGLVITNEDPSMLFLRDKVFCTYVGILLPEVLCIDLQ